MSEKDLRSKEIFGQRVTLCELVEGNNRRYEIRLHDDASYQVIERRLTRPAGIRSFEDFPGKRADMIDQLQHQYADLLDQSL
jgi:hypothetical protein